MPTLPAASLRRAVRLAIAGAGLSTLTVLAAGVVSAADRSIEMRDFAFSPGSVEIRVGDSVTWTNRDSVEHNATDGSFDTGLLGQGESASIRFDAPGTYAFLCEPHPSMTGTVVVRSTAAPPTDTVPDAPGGGQPIDLRLTILVAGLGLGTLAATRQLQRRRHAEDDRTSD
jgi:plastocyanin